MYCLVYNMSGNRGEKVTKAQSDVILKLVLLNNSPKHKDIKFAVPSDKEKWQILKQLELVKIWHLYLTEKLIK